MSAVPIQIIDLSAVAAYPAGTAPQVDLSAICGTGQNVEFLFIVSDGGGATPDGVVEVSFDGLTDHCELRRGTAIEAVTWDTNARKVWFKKVSGTNPVKVTVMAELKAK